jgi:hypothetical protein
MENYNLKKATIITNISQKEDKHSYDNDITIHYVYLLKEREFVRTNENVYKIGKSTQANLSRFSQYPNGSILYFQMICKDCSKIERNIINSFRSRYINRTDIGNEYFEGNYDDMIHDMYYEINKFHNKKMAEDEKIENDNNVLSKIDFSMFAFKPT